MGLIDSMVPGRHTVYAAALNRSATLAALGDALRQPPYQAPPRAPVLHLKPANTWSRPGAPVRCPPGAEAVALGGGIGLVVGRRATRVAESAALDHLAGLVVVNDVHVPYSSHFRPAIAQRCRDGFCPFGSLASLVSGTDPDRLAVTVEIDGRTVAREGPGYVRSAARLLADLTTFLTLAEGDVVLLGELADPPLARPGQSVRVIVDDVGDLVNPIVA
ncbi:MAG: hypothetical protein FJ206_11950 [Gemmatimonadetes bacterium]|nr:hypothetical protein [Gemmatimonadota bacterium]